MKMHVDTRNRCLFGISAFLVVASTSVTASAIDECQPPLVDPDPSFVIEGDGHEYEDELVGSDFGFAVQASDDVLVITARRFEVNYVYELNAENEFVSTTTFPGPRCVLDDQHLLCGGDEEARIYVRESFGNWTLEFDSQQDLDQYSPQPNGLKIAFEDDLFACADSNSAMIYARQADGSWDFESYISIASSQFNGEAFSSIAINDGTLLIGDSTNDDEALHGGAIYTFQRGEHTGHANMYFWNHHQTLRYHDSEARFLGSRMSASGDLMVTKCTDPGPSDSPIILAYRYDGANWNLSSEITAESLGLEDATSMFGWVFDTDGERIIVSDPDADDTAGAAYVLASEPGGWSIENVLTRSDNADDSMFGLALSINGSTALASTITRVIDYTYVIPGKGYVFDLNEQPCTADFDADGNVNVTELLTILGSWGSDEPAYDLDGDDTIGVGDLLLVLTFWGECG